MKLFIKRTRKLLYSKLPLCFIIGNESCDLDSAVCALCLTFFYNWRQTKNSISSTKNYIPVLNIPRKDYALKTEVKFLFNKYEISAADLIFRDDLQPALMDASEFILVDHHVSPFAQRCIEVFDHRPHDAMANLPAQCKVHLENVGSCATLIGELVLQHVTQEEIQSQETEFSVLLALLRSTIVLDTVNFEPKAARATPKDHAICAQLEEALKNLPTNVPKTRDELFNMLVRARADISTLTTAELLRKDLKFLTNHDASIRVALPGFPLLVQEFITKTEAVDAVRHFAIENNCAIVLLIGMFVRESDGGVERDIGLINFSAPQLCAAILKSLLSSTEPALNLELIDDCQFLDGHFYKQQNVTVTRKHILPLVNRQINKWSLGNIDDCAVNT